MGLDWIRLPRPRPGHEEEYRSLKAAAAGILDDPEETEWVVDWGMKVGWLNEEERELMLRLHAISLYPRETWNQFIGGVWAEARDALAGRPELPLPAEERALLSCPSFAGAMRLLAERFPGAEYERYDHLDRLLGDCRWGLTRYTARELHLLNIGWDDGSVWRWFSLAPGVWDEVDHLVDQDSTAEQCLASARLLRRTVCDAVRRIIPSLADQADEEIEAQFQRWGEHRWRQRQGVLGACPLAPPAWVEELAALDEAAERARREGTFGYGRTPTREMLERGIAAFGVARWLEFWGTRGHGFVRSA